MDTVLKADIFFFISSVAIIVLTGLLSVVLYYFIKAGRNLHKLSEALQDRFAHSEEFVLELKERLEENPAFRLFFPPARHHYAKENKRK